MGRNDRIYTSDEVGRRLGLSPVSVRAYAPRYGVGERKRREWRFSEADIEVYLQRPGRGRPRKRA